MERSVGGGGALRVDLVGRAADLDLLGDSDFESALPREGHEYRELAGGPLDGLLFDGPGGAMSIWPAALC
ncbi:hypothetical protein [Streptomyces sp. NPDC056323]|uniref:hypothetical protein n=1 Tax=Streptomyces sp. NPDC056323 TaxID=3345784 RepID=UPI0035E17733